MRSGAGAVAVFLAVFLISLGTQQTGAWPMLAYVLPGAILLGAGLSLIGGSR